MPNLISGSSGGRPKTGAMGVAQISLEHYYRLLLHRKWLIVATFMVVTIVTVVVVAQLPDIYTSETLILVDPQKVPESYVRATVTGDVRNRLSTLEQQILSATRLQKIIDGLKLYAEDRGKLAREEIIGRMRRDISIRLVSDFGRPDTLQAFKISFSGRDPRLVARVVNELAALFINENLKAREQQATGTTEFLESQLVDTRTALEGQESKLRDFRLKHIGEMPEQETSNLQILGQLQSQLHLVGEALARAEQQKSMTQAMMSQTAPVVELEDSEPEYAAGRGPREARAAGPAAPQATPKTRLVALLNERLKRGYTESHPDIRRLRAQIANEEKKEPKIAEVRPVEPETEPKPNAAPPASNEPAPARRYAAPPPAMANPVLVSQIRSLDAEIEREREEQQRLQKRISAYQAKLEAIPVRQQEMTQLVRDYEISKAHYAQLLDKQLSAETATQLEIRQKGEKFSILDPAQPGERPSSPNRKMLDMGGACAGFALGIVLALVTEIRGMSITATDQLLMTVGDIPVLETIPLIETEIDQRRRRRRLVWATVSGAVFMALACGAGLLYRYRG